MNDAASNALIASPVMGLAVWAIVRNLRGAIRHDRRRADRVAAQRIARVEGRPEPGRPGSNQQLLDACKTAYYGPNHQHRKETP